MIPHWTILFCLSLRLADRAAAHGPALQQAAAALTAILVCPALVRGADLGLWLLNGATAHGQALQHAATALTAILVCPALVRGADLGLGLLNGAAAHGQALQHAATALTSILVCPALIRGADLRLGLLNGAAAHGQALQHTAAALTALLIRPALIHGASQVGGQAVPTQGEVVLFSCKICVHFGSETSLYLLINVSVVSGYRVAGVPSTTENEATTQTTAKRTMESLKFIMARFLGGGNFN